MKHQYFTISWLVRDMINCLFNRALEIEEFGNSGKYSKILLSIELYLRKMMTLLKIVTNRISDLLERT